MWRKYYVPLQTDIELGGALTITYIERYEGRAEIIPIDLMQVTLP